MSGERREIEVRVDQQISGIIYLGRGGGRLYLLYERRGSFELAYQYAFDEIKWRRLKDGRVCIFTKQEFHALWYPVVVEGERLNFSNCGHQDYGYSREHKGGKALLGIDGTQVYEVTGSGWDREIRYGYDTFESILY